MFIGYRCVYSTQKCLSTYYCFVTTGSKAFAKTQPDQGFAQFVTGVAVEVAGVNSIATEQIVIADYSKFITRADSAIGLIARLAIAAVDFEESRLFTSVVPQYTGGCCRLYSRRSPDLSPDSGLSVVVIVGSKRLFIVRSVQRSSLEHY